MVFAFTQNILFIRTYKNERSRSFPPRASPLNQGCRGPRVQRVAPRGERQPDERRRAQRRRHPNVPIVRISLSSCAAGRRPPTQGAPRLQRAPRERGQQKKRHAAALRSRKRPRVVRGAPPRARRRVQSRRRGRHARSAGIQRPPRGRVFHTAAPQSRSPRRSGAAQRKQSTSERTRSSASFKSICRQTWDPL